jgi:hypothetical protein
MSAEDLVDPLDPEPPGIVICILCKRTVYIERVMYPATFTTECETTYCPVNAEYKPDPIPEFGDPPSFVNHIEFADNEDS